MIDIFVEIEKDIKNAGGYYLWRDECLLENLKAMDFAERQLIKVRLRHHTGKNPHTLMISKSYLK